MTIDEVLHNSRVCSSCKGARTVTDGRWIAYEARMALHAAADHDAKSPVPQRREEAVKMRRQADEAHGRAYIAGDDGTPVMRDTDDGPLRPCPRQTKCQACEGTGTQIVPPNPLQVRAVLVALLSRIEALEAEVLRLGLPRRE